MKVSQEPRALRAGVEALQHSRYLEAIDRLETYCQQQEQDLSEPTCVMAQLLLVKAYFEGGELDRALVLCQDLCHATQVEIRAWVVDALPILQMEAEQQALPWQQRLHGDLPALPPLEEALPQVS
jgi:hypothetical protein